MPRNGRRTRPTVSSSGSTRLTVDAGTAKPIPTLPEEPSPVAICELTPITRPVASSSGPPELPGLIAASVWITSSIGSRSGAVIRRCSAETTPVVSVRSSPKGLPIATVGSPTLHVEESPSASGCRAGPFGLTASTARSVSGSLPMTRAETVRWSENDTRTSVEAATTCALVRMWPFSSSTKPEPVATFSCWRGKTSNGDWLAASERARTNTTPGAARR